MTELSLKEQDLLKRVDRNEDLRPLFFRKVRGLKWFDELYERGYFNPQLNPKPVPAKEEGYVNIPPWPIVDYLAKSAPELSNEVNIEYAKKFFELLVNITNYAKENNYSNYRTWWQFSEIISNIPTKVITIDQLNIVDYWLEDKYDSILVVHEIGRKWLPKLLETNDEHNLQIATKLISFLYKATIVERKFGEGVRRQAAFRFDSHEAMKISEKIAYIAGVKLGRDAISIFSSNLTYIIKELNSDLWSYIWQPSIDEHEQNKYKDDPENILVYSYRNSLSGYITTNPEDSNEYIMGMLEEEYQTIHRLAIYAINRDFLLFQNLIDKLLDKEYFGSNYHHEIWQLMNQNYQNFTSDQKQRVLELIHNIIRKDDDGNINQGATAYHKAIWLAAIKNHGENEAELYKENTEISKVEPEHPDFSSYMSSGWVGHESPIPIEDIQALPMNKLIEVLSNYQDPGDFYKPGIQGLALTFKQVIKTSPLEFYNKLDRFSDLNFAYVCEIIEAYRELWTEKSQLPWNDILMYLLDFCSTIINQERFWDTESTNQQEHFAANRYWIVKAIGRFVEAGTKSDDHAFDEKYLPKTEEIITLLLKNEKGNEFKLDSDAVSISINSPRGQCLEALINLTLRSCRLSDKKNNKNHSDVWAHFQPLYDTELAKADSQNPEFEFATLITNYLPNFLYMSKEWVLENLSRIFDQRNYLRWLCAMQGYAYVGIVYEEIYHYLKDNGDLIKALDDQNIDDHVEERIIQNIAIAYINDFENFAAKNSLIKTLVSRKNNQELNHLIWFIWTLRRKDNKDLKSKVYELWPKILEVIDVSMKEGKRIISQLSLWSTFVDQVDNESRDLLLKVAPYADEAYNSNKLLESIAKISQNQPFEAYHIWIKLLEGSSPDYPKEAVQKILTSLSNQGPEGLRMAKDVVSHYLKRGNERPALLLREITKES